MKKCELCGGLARMHCESDQANLCWDCDVKVHGANFIVAKHSRTLLCHVCQNPTPWLASGQNLRPAFSVCDSCVGNDNKRNSHNHDVISQKKESSKEECGEEEEKEDYEDNEEEENEGYEEEEEKEEKEDYEVDDEGYEEEEEEEEENYEDEEEEEEDGENQVVPRSGESSPFSKSKPMTCLDPLSSSKGGDGGGSFGLKRMRENLSSYSDDEIECSSSHMVSGGSSNGESTSMGSSRLLKQPRLGEVNQSARNNDHDQRLSSFYKKNLEKHMIADDGDAPATTMLSKDQSR